MTKKYLSVVLTVLAFFGNATFAEKVDIEVENTHYTSRTKLEGLFAWKQEDEQTTFEISIPSKNAKHNKLTGDIDIDPVNITCVVFSLYNDEPSGDANDEKNGDQNLATILATAQIIPKEEKIKSLKIIIGERKLTISATY